MTNETKRKPGRPRKTPEAAVNAIDDEPEPIEEAPEAIDDLPEPEPMQIEERAIRVPMATEVQPGFVGPHVLNLHIASCDLPALNRLFHALVERGETVTDGRTGLTRPVNSWQDPFRWLLEQAGKG